VIPGIKNVNKLYVHSRCESDSKLGSYFINKHMRALIKLYTAWSQIISKQKYQAYVQVFMLHTC